MNVKKAAELFANNRLLPKPMERLDKAIRPETERDAYAIQEKVHLALERRGLGPRVGYKIGCTTLVMQEFLNIHHPCAGGIMASTIYQNHAQLRYKDFVRIGIECEIGICLGRDISGTDLVNTYNSIYDSVEFCMASAEIVDNRYSNFGSMGTPSLIADDFFGAGCVLGKPVKNWQDLDLKMIEGCTVINDQEVGHGTGATVLGHPFEAVAWLANMKCEAGKKLTAGDVILTGSMVETIWPSGADSHVKISIKGLGPVEIDIT